VLQNSDFYKLLWSLKKTSFFMQLKKDFFLISICGTIAANA
jgi:hypothetical protein